ncbi:hypothetical protein IFU01_12435 [Oxalobacteraceae sp. CFBP 8763]|nr:hypothetical protein [Oxalobacteraceae sp. CFBP 8763]
MTALFKNQQQENLPARDRRDWNEIESIGELHGLIANDGYAASFQDLGQYRSALVRHMGNVLRRLATGQSTVRAWRERMGKPADWPLHAPTDVERAMVAEIAELRAQQAAAPDAKPGWQWVPVEPNLGMITSGFESAPDEFFSPTAEWDAYAEMTGCQKAAHRARLCYAAMLAAAPTALGAPEAPHTAAARDVLAERHRQIKAEGYDHENDDNYVNDEMAAAAAFYVMPPGVRDWAMDGTGYGATLGEAIYPDWMPPKIGDRRRDLVKGAALALAEIERLDRAAQLDDGHGEKS